MGRKKKIDRDQWDLTPPASMEAEQALLANILADNKRFDEISDRLEPFHFADAGHARIYAQIKQRLLKGEPATGPLLGPVFANDPGFDEFGGGASYVEELAEASTGIIDVEHFAKTIIKLWELRQLEEACEDTIERVRTRSFGKFSDDVIIEKHESALRRIFDSGQTERVQFSAAEAVQLALREAEEERSNPDGSRHLSTGYSDIDRHLGKGGFPPANLIILAARPSMGKTAVSLNFARQQAKAGKRVAYFSLEQDQREIGERLLAAEADYGMAGLFGRQGVPPQKQAHIEAAVARVQAMPLELDLTSRPTIAGLLSHCRRMQREGGLDAVYIDQLGYIRYVGSSDNRTHQLGETTKALKAMARQLEVPVIVLHQLSRALESRQDKRPTLADLRDSGEIEQDADMVMFLYREAYYLERDGKTDEAERERNNLEIIIAKQRQFRIAHFRMFVDLDKQLLMNPFPQGDLLGG